MLPNSFINIMIDTCLTKTHLSSNLNTHFYLINLYSKLQPSIVQRLPLPLPLTPPSFFTSINPSSIHGVHVSAAFSWDSFDKAHAFSCRTRNSWQLVLHSFCMISLFKSTVPRATMSRPAKFHKKYILLHCLAVTFLNSICKWAETATNRAFEMSQSWRR
jgi:hypothetical protein